jgi:hypothetical protein
MVALAQKAIPRSCSSKLLCPTSSTASPKAYSKSTTNINNQHQQPIPTTGIKFNINDHHQHQHQQPESKSNTNNHHQRQHRQPESEFNINN